MRRRGLAVAFGLATAVAVACSSFEEGNDGLPSADGGAEANVDSSGSDGAADAASDGARDADAHTFSDDFDDGPLGARWVPGKLVTAPAVLELVTTAAVSPPFSLHAGFPDYQGEPLLDARLM